MPWKTLVYIALSTAFCRTRTACRAVDQDAVRRGGAAGDLDDVGLEHRADRAVGHREGAQPHRLLLREAGTVRCVQPPETAETMSPTWPAATPSPTLSAAASQPSSGETVLAGGVWVVRVSDDET